MKEKLEKLIREAQHAYYNSVPIMSDAEYDALVDELREIDPDNQLLKVVGAEPSVDSRLQKVSHVIPMGSLSKVNTVEEFSKWAEGKGKLILQPKYDGISVSVRYVKGKLIQVVSRGSGTEGEDITHNLRKCLPEKLHYTFTGYLRGECIIKKSTFEQYFAETNANPRNAASGTARRLDSAGAEHLTVKFFDIIDEKQDFITERDKIDALKLLGFETDNCPVVGIENAIKWYKHYETKLRSTLDYEIDGLVLKVNSVDDQTALGDVNGRPKGQIAWKFAPEMRKSILRNVIWQVGNTGRITPVAIFDPVKIGGVTIEKSSLHNVSNIKTLGLQMYSEVLISRRNDVIPYVEMCVKAGTEEIAIPSVCPSCEEELTFEGEYLTCTNMLCYARDTGNIKKWIKVLDIEECGDSFVEDVMSRLNVRAVSDLYTLTEEELKTLPGYQEAKTNKVLDNLAKSKNPPFELFLAALNIPNVSVNTFTILKKHGFDTIDKLKSASINALTNVPGVGEITAETIVNAFQDLRLLSLINKLFEVGIKIKEDVKGKLTGMSFCFTGELSIKRPDAMKLVKELGGETKTSVSKGLTYLVQSNPQSTSSKSEKARKYGTKVIGEREFLDLVEFSFDKLRS